MLLTLLTLLVVLLPLSTDCNTPELVRRQSKGLKQQTQPVHTLVKLSQNDTHKDKATANYQLRENHLGRRFVRL